ncbi:MAG: acylphosphatase [Chloroflexi bacterium]|jgi:acylphosphatase|nr:acylphosphatase [Chloroflexota bacterium]
MSDEEQRQEKKRFRAIVRGRVQGVNFRNSTQYEARKLGVVGYVRNQWDGTVEVVAEGEADAIRKLISWLHAGPSLAHVSRVEIQWEAPRNEFAEFEVRF